MRKYRKHEKRRAYSEYELRSKLLSESLKSGKIKQEEFEREHELLDEQFNFVR
jgi:hypothetical protein